MTAENPTRAYDRMLAGLPYRVPDDELQDMMAAGTRAYQAVNATEGSGDFETRRHLLRKYMGAFGESFFNPPITWEYGTHIFVGDRCLINSDCLFMDGASITIGTGTLIAPRAMLITAGHPILPEERMILDPATGALDHGIAVNKPITIGRDCWIGAGATILGGVTIGDGTTVGAGAVVPRSLPSRVLAAGNPARVIRELPPAPL